MDRRQIGAYLSPEAIEGFRRWAEHHDVDRTSLIEAFGCYLATKDPAERSGTPPLIRALLKHARAVHRERFARPKR